MNREFFNTNSIQNFKTFITQKPQSSITRHFHSTQKLKRVTSCRDTTSKLNPQKFINREVFNSKLYSTKPFNIAVQFNKESQQKIHKLFSFENNDTISQIQNKIRKQTTQQFVSGINNLSHYFRTIHQEIESEGNPSNGSLKKQMMLLKEGFEKIMKILSKEIEHYQKSYVNLMFANKTQQNTLNASKFEKFEGTGRFSSTKQWMVSSRQLLDTSTQQNFFTSKQTSFIKPSTSSSLRSSRIFEPTQSTQLKNLTNKLNLIEFENKKHILRIQNLQKEKKQNNQKIVELQKKTEEMFEKILKVNEMEEMYNYKIKKLKEELEVAHIVKEQNLAEKMKYILSNQ